MLSSDHHGHYTHMHITHTETQTHTYTRKQYLAQFLAYSKCSVNALLSVSPTERESGTTSTPMWLTGAPLLPHPGHPTDTHLHRLGDVPDCTVDYDPQHSASRLRVRVLVRDRPGPQSSAAEWSSTGLQGQTDLNPIPVSVCHLAAV